MKHKIITKMKHLAAVALCFTCLSLFGQNVTGNPRPVQTFFNPLPENDVLEALIQIEGDWAYDYKPQQPVYSYTYITVFADDTVIYYDQCENGYESDIANPKSIYSSKNKLGTQIWGDGDLSNGCAPGTTDDQLKAGSIIKLESEITLANRGTALYYDGRDKWATSKPCAASRAVWAAKSQTMLASANEMYDTTFFGNEFIAPVGVDTANQKELFQYTGFMIMAGENGATVKTSLNNKEVVLKQGETIFVNGNVKQGDWVKATSGNVQVELITGDIYDNFEARFIKLLPRNMWSTSYTCPVVAPTSVTSGKSSTICGSSIWIYNPNNTALNVSCKTRSGTKTVSVPAKSAKEFVPDSYKSGTYLSADKDFYALEAFNSGGTDTSYLTTSKGKTSLHAGDNKTWDWGFALVADNALSPQILIGFGLGCDPTSSKSPENGAPIWITCPWVGETKNSNMSATTKVYVKYPNSTGKMKDNLGNPCDAVYDLKPLEILKIYNPNEKTMGQTGMTIWTTDGTRLAAAWGEDPNVATSGEPGIDMGTGIPPMPEIRIQKVGKLSRDVDEDGFIGCGDYLEYTIDIYNSGRITLTDVHFGDEFSDLAKYVLGSLTFTGYDAKGKIAYPTRTLDDSTWNSIVNGGVLLNKTLLKTSENPSIEPNGKWSFTYKTQIGDKPAPFVPNMAWANNKYTIVSNRVEVILRSKVGDHVWLDDGDGIQEDGEPPIPGIVVRLVDTEGNIITDDNNIPYETTTDENGDYLFVGVRPGEYKVEFEIPEIYEPTVRNSTDDDSKDSDVDEDGFSDEFELIGGESNLTIDAGLKVKPDVASIQLIKTASETLVEEGTEVTYSYLITNTGKSYLHDVEVNDDKLGLIGKLEGVLAPGESASLTATTKISILTTNIADVVGIPGDELGNELPGLPEKVVDNDKAVVDVIKKPEPTPEPVDIGDFVWNDSNKNGIQDENEMGVYGVKVELYDAEGQLIATTNTDATGYYIFKDVEPGDYTIHFIPNGNWSFTKPFEGEDSENDSNADENGYAAITVYDGQDDYSIDCGLVGGVPPGICEWIDMAYLFNAIIVGNFNPGGGDTEGNLLVMGDAVLPAGYSVGSIGPGYNRTRLPAPYDKDTLIVGGSLYESTTPDMNGNIVYGVNHIPGDRIWDGGYSSRKVNPITIDENGNVPEDGSGTTFAEIINDITTFSEIVAAMPQSEGIITNMDVWATGYTLRLTGTNEFRNIFVIDDNLTMLSPSAMVVTIPVGAKAVFNFTGDYLYTSNTSITIQDMNGNLVDPSLVLFNMANMETMETHGFVFQGSVIAPKLKNSYFYGGAIDGFAFLNGNVVSGTGFEFHDFEFRAFDCSRSDVVVQKPDLKLTVITDDMKDGKIQNVETGSVITVVQTIENNSDFDVKDVVLVDILGRKIIIGDMKSHETVVKEVKLPTGETAADTTIKYEASVSGTGIGTPAYDGVKVEDGDSATIKVVDELPTIDDENTNIGSSYIPRPDFEIIDFGFIKEPTVTGDVFSVSVTIKNGGEVPQYPGRLGIFIGHPEVMDNLKDVIPDSYIDIPGKLEVDSSATYTFNNLIAPIDAGILHVRAAVDCGEVVDELSEGNNQLPICAWLIPVKLNIKIEDGEVVIDWNSEEGQVFQLIGTDSLTNDYETLQLPDLPLWISATPPMNEVRIPIEDLKFEDGKFFRFFRVVAKLADDVQ